MRLLMLLALTFSSWSLRAQESAKPCAENLGGHRAESTAGGPSANPKIPAVVSLWGTKANLVPEDPAHHSQMREILSDQKTMAHLLSMTYRERGGWTLADIQRRGDNFRRAQLEQRALPFTVIDVTSGAVAGNCGLHSVSLPDRRGEFGIIIHHPFWKSGIATDCHLLGLRYAFEFLGLHRVDMQTSEHNGRMRGFLESAGFTLEAVKKDFNLNDGTFSDEVVYVLFEHEWPATRAKLEAKLARQSGGTR